MTIFRNTTLSMLTILVMTGVAMAAPVTFTGTLGSLASSATFDTSGNNLVVTLTNISTADVLIPSDVLTAVFFDSGATLTPQSALLNAGSTVFFGSDGGGNVGGEWAYGSGLAGAPGGATQGISSSGFGLFGAGNFNGPDLEPPAAVDGVQYGITSAGDNPATGNAAVTGNNALIQNSVVFTLSGLPAGFDPFASISHVSFQYGTALTEPNIPPDVPEPGFYGILMAGLSGLVFMSWRRRKEMA